MTEHRDFLLVLERQRAVVLQKDSAFTHFFYVLRKSGFQRSRLRIGVIKGAKRALVIDRVSGFSGVDELGGARAERRVDVASVCQGKRLSDEGQDQNYREDTGKSGPEFAFSQNCFLLFLFYFA